MDHPNCSHSWPKKKCITSFMEHVSPDPVAVANKHNYFPTKYDWTCDGSCGTQKRKSDMSTLYDSGKSRKLIHDANWCVSNIRHNNEKKRSRERKLINLIGPYDTVEQE